LGVEKCRLYVSFANLLIVLAGLLKKLFKALNTYVKKLYHSLSNVSMGHEF